MSSEQTNHCFSSESLEIREDREENVEKFRKQEEISKFIQNKYAHWSKHTCTCLIKLMLNPLLKEDSSRLSPCCRDCGKDDPRNPRSNKGPKFRCSISDRLCSKEMMSNDICWWHYHRMASLVENYNGYGKDSAIIRDHHGIDLLCKYMKIHNMKIPSLQIIRFD